MVTIGPMLQVGCASACSTVTPLKSARSRNGPPLAVNITCLTSERFPLKKHWYSAECSESTGIIRSLPNAMTKSPPATSDSLFASATLLPTPSAARVGPSPMDPVIPFKTMSQGIVAISLEAFAPSITWISPAIPSSAFLSAVVPTTGTENFLACSNNNFRFDEPAERPTTRNLSALAATISSAWTPMEPVDPRITISRMRLSYGIGRASFASARL